MTPGMVADRLGVPKLVGKLPRRPVSGLLGPFGPWAPWALGPVPALYIMASREGTSEHARSTMGPWAQGAGALGVWLGIHEDAAGHIE